MVIRSTDARRRRVVIEEAASQLENTSSESGETAETETAAGRKKKPARNYLPGAQRRHQPKATDWIPKRRSSVAIFMAALFAVVAAIIGATWLVPAASDSELSHGIRERFSVHGSISLSVWFSTVLLLVSGLASLQIHALRQHRSNDYRGTYRVWLWFSGLLILASVNCVIDLGGLLQDWTGRVRSGSFTWTSIAVPAAQVLVLGIIFVRGVVEVRKSPASLAVISLVWLAYVVSIALRVPGIESHLVQDDGFSAASLNLFATAGILAAITVYARHVYLRANGLVEVEAEAVKPKRKPRVAKKRSSSSSEDAADGSKPVAKKKPLKTSRPKPSVKTVEADEADDETADEAELKKVVEPPRTQTAPVTRDRFAKPEVVEESPDFSEEYSDNEPGVRTLSKSERKRMKKLQRNMNERRAA